MSERMFVEPSRPGLWIPPGGPVSLDDFIEAGRRATAVLGEDAVFDDRATDEIERQLYAMALESPEGEVFI